VTDPPDVLSQLRALVTPETLLLDPKATGEGVAVCVVDSGVERDVLEQKFARTGRPIRTIEGGVFRPGHTAPLPYSGHQSSPHGTTVADIILTIAPGIRLYSADVFGVTGSCDVEMLVRAIRWASDVWHCRIINLSLGVTEPRLQPPAKRLQLQRTIEECYLQDILVIAAAHNDHPITRSYPAAFAPSLLSVDKELFDDPLRFAYDPRASIEFAARGLGYLGPFAAEPATSWAAPHLSGIVARLLSLRPGLKPFEIKTLLYWMSPVGQDRRRARSAEPK
jgi:subtilisin family serine protease